MAVLTAGTLALALVLVAGPAAAEAVATAARVGGDEDRTRFVADLSETVGYSVYVLPNPYRVVIDLPDVRFDLPPDAGSQARGLISEYRYGEMDDARSRIVIDTKGPVLIEKSFVVEPQAGQPARIVVDLVRTSHDAFMKTYEAEAQASGQPAAHAASETREIDRNGEAAVIPIPRPKPGTEPPPASTKKAAALPPRDRKLIVIDPGHGGIDPGAIGLKKTLEKDVVLAFGLHLRDHLSKDGRYEVVMTRSGDEFLTLRDRVRVAREREADLFIAIHADTVRGPAASGATIYTLSEKASDAEAEALAHKENRADIIGGLDLGTENEEVAGILIDLAQRESKKHAVFFARKAVNEMRTVTHFTGKPLRSAGFVVLKAPDVPSVLVELGYLSTAKDETQLSSPKWQDAVSAAMARAVDKYFSTEVAVRID
ncbi:MAG: N-acetylmuramoyl-L-alanine amidase [Alphaproteobacteria bacterium]|nr:N-acetylmuramoyl-L-alanine amidase [Alphaproteobacteria bacterium]